MAAERLKSALADQARWSDAHAAAQGTDGEGASHLRLQASNLQVAVCSRLVHGAPSEVKTAAT